MRKEIIWSLCLTIVSGVNYALAFTLRIMWHTEIYYFVLIVLIFAFLFGLVMVDMEKTIIGTVLSLLLGAFVSFTLIISPTIVHGESMFMINLAIMTTLNAIALNLLLSLAAASFGAIAGFLLGERLLYEAR